ncbi:MAG: hypothetical protein ACKVHP_00360 [Verrucomicrobiales bacterium]
MPMLALLGQERVLLRFREAAGKLD